MARALIVTPWSGTGTSGDRYRPQVAGSYTLTNYTVTSDQRPPLARNLGSVDATLSDVTLTAIQADSGYVVVWSTSGNTIPTTTPDTVARTALIAKLTAVGYTSSEANAVVGTGQYTYSQIGDNLIALQRYQSPPGVPRSDPDWTQSVDAWWAQHPYNSASPRYLATISSPANPIDVESAYSGDLQAAIDALPASGGTLQLGARTYPRVKLIGKSNVHLLGAGTGSTLLRGIEVYGSAICEDYWTYAHSLWAGEAAALSASRDPGRARNIYLKDIGFNGGGVAVTEKECAIFVRGVRDLLVDGCSFSNYTTAVDGRHPGHISAAAYADNIWARNCSFVGAMKCGIYFDGVHSGGVLGSTFSHTIVAQRVLGLSNNDFTYDLDGDGRYERHGFRDPQYLVIAGNTFTTPINGTIPELIHVQGGNVLIANNTIGANGTVGIVATQGAHCTNPYQLIPGYVYDSAGWVIENNTGGTVTTYCKIDGATGSAPSGVTTCQAGYYGRVGGVVVRNNTPSSVVTWIQQIAPVSGSVMLNGSAV